MVLPSTLNLIKVIRHILAKHNIAEEELEGLNDICEIVRLSN